MSNHSRLDSLHDEITGCRLCPRLVRWREDVAKIKTRRFTNEEYWGKPIPGFGDPDARLLLVGLAPAAHGGNRTGRMFTGDESGNWLFRALFKAGFANQPASTNRSDGLQLTDCFITATLRCAPPQNKPSKEEILHCKPYLHREVSMLQRMRVVVGLGKIGFDAAFLMLVEMGLVETKKKPKFAHCAVYEFGTITLISSFHPSQQNTFTGRLTEPMFDRIFTLAKQFLKD